MEKTGTEMIHVLLSIVLLDLVIVHILHHVTRLRMF